MCFLGVSNGVNLSFFVNAANKDFDPGVVNEERRFLPPYFSTL